MLIRSNGRQIDLLRGDHTQATAVAYLGSAAQWDSFAFVMVSGTRKCHDVDQYFDPIIKNSGNQ
ncbi:hypothetical protein OE766_07325 [Pararhizobium sp. YC-54]|uniref:hypothetical protein n=1 Tax=Pararhizobium sp. YC-54 TaxID=2986920 RepID=UPI0021F6A4A6|nr:hypothetical protein [Pararhizobium sp. YC-54]MCV9998052.1 hypothetical protein [Pararhizobium sp. YC-54]